MTCCPTLVTRQWTMILFVFVEMWYSDMSVTLNYVSLLLYIVMVVQLRMYVPFNVIMTTHVRMNTWGDIDLLMCWRKFTQTLYLIFNIS